MKATKSPAVPSLPRRTCLGRPSPTSTQFIAKRRSCDRCYKKKERCTYEHGAEDCTHCARSHLRCTHLRSRSRPGRKPKATPSGEHGSFHVWDAGGAPVVVESLSDDASQEHSPAISNEGDGTDGSHCAVEGGELVRHYHREETSPALWRRGLGVSMEQFFDLQSASIEFFYATNDIFMLGPTFADEFHTTLRLSYDFSPGFLRDSYQAMFTALVWARHQAASFDQVDISRGALSLRRLRTFSVCSLRDAVAVLSLGPTLAAFDVLTRCLGSVTILRHSLETVQEWYPTLSSRPGLDPLIISAIFWDTAHCLIRREVPVIRYLVRDPCTVDRVAGMCTTLLPFLHDLCVASKKWRHSQAAYYASTIEEVERNIISWKPSFNAESNMSFSKQEILAMTSQASMYRIAALLVIHRLFNPVGTADDVAKAYAGDILANLQDYLTSSGQGQKLQHTAFPIFLAALEIPNLAKETWICISLLKEPSICLNKLSTAVDYVWKQRSEGFSGFLFDLLEIGPEFVVIP